MPASYRPYAPDQDLLLQPRLQEWLPEGHLSYFINDVIKELVLGAFYKPYEKDDDRKPPGRRAEDGATSGTSGCRKIKRRVTSPILRVPS